MKRLIAITLGVLTGLLIALFIGSCNKNTENSCNQEQQNMVTAQGDFKSFCQQIGIEAILDDSQISPITFTYLGSGQWENDINSNIVTSQYDPHQTWTSLRDYYQSKMNIYETCSN